MSELDLTGGLLRRIARQNNFVLSDEYLVFAGIRGAMPADPDDLAFASARRVKIGPPDYESMRCTLVQWRPGDDQVAVFAGSTVPNRRAISAARRGGAAANMVILGFHRYAKGQHKSGQPRGHQAFRQASFLPVWRTRDDDDYDLDDSIDLGANKDTFFWDNLHAAFHESPRTPGFSSNGCQVVAGFPTTNDGSVTESGPWARFRQNAYDHANGQASFAYMLVEGAAVERLADASDDEISQVARYGSSGSLVADIQRALSSRGGANPVDGRFGRETLRALFDFQRAALGADKADGVVGPTTALALGLTMPTVDGRVPTVAVPMAAPRPAPHPTDGGSSRIAEAVIAAALASQTKWGVPASVTIAQYILESGNGAHMPPGSNNPFGIKASGGQPYVEVGTSEVRNGVWRREPARFRKFPTLADAFDAHGKLLATAPAYRAAMRQSKDAGRFCDALTGVYATDPGYGGKLKRVIARYDLAQFDATDEIADPPPPIVVAAQTESADVRAVQQRLKELGYPVGQVDGKFGNITAAALLAFQNENRLPTTGLIDDLTRAALPNAGNRQLDNDRTAATAEELKKRGSVTIRDAFRTKLLGKVAAALGLLGIGNSAIVNSGTPAAPDSLVATNVRALLTGAEQLAAPGGNTPEAANRVAGLARDIAGSPDALSFLPSLARALAQLRQVLPPEIIARNPDLDRMVQGFAAARTAAQPVMTTIFDRLPAFFTDQTNLQFIAKGVAAVAGSVIPGFGGSLATLAIGLAANYFGQKVVDARVKDHREGQNLER
ncbi:peptidoglycan-binding protein [Methylobacterium sp. D53M]